MKADDFHDCAGSRAGNLARTVTALATGATAAAVGACGDGGGPPTGDDAPPTPVAEMRPTELEAHGHVRTDNYYWLRERENPEVIEYLEAENAYTDVMTAHTAGLRQDLFDEIKGRIRQDDSSVPVRRGDYFYYSRTEDGLDYPIHARKRYSVDADEEIILDVNELAQGHDYYSAFPDVGPDGNLMAYAEDTVGRRLYTIRFKNLGLNREFGEVIENTSGNTAWAENERTIYYTKRDPNTLRAYQVFRHYVGQDPANDELVYQEDDEEFSVGVWKTKSKKFVVISSSHTTMDEHRIADATDPKAEFSVFVPRERGHEHSLDHIGSSFYIRTNRDGATNFKLAVVPDENWEGLGWRDVVRHRGHVFLEGFELFETHLVVEERTGGLVRLLVAPWGEVFGGSFGSRRETHHIEFGDPAYLAWIDANPEPATEILRFGYTSPAAPRSVYDYNMRTGERTLLKEDEVLGGFDRTDYQVERLEVPSRDGSVAIPVSIVYHQDHRGDGPSPLLLYAYGSYGASTEATFSSSRLSLLDRGFVYAIAHVRGGQELGREWYEGGKMFNKINTFTDFIDVADHLVGSGWVTPDKLFAMGGSAGGLLMGAVVNMRPELFRGVVAAVPFVDVVTTMLDETIPLTTFEYDEWGDPNEQESYQYMLSYSPYDRVEAKDYPNILVTAGLHDSQVQYWEPAKWVARLRAMKTDNNTLLLKTHMDAGHGGGSGRDRRYEEIAFQYAFMLDLLER